MTAAPYSRVLRGQRTPAARTKYLQYLEGLNQPDRTNKTPKNRPASNTLYVTPFGKKIGTDQLLQTSALKNSYLTLKTGIGATRVFDALPQGKTALQLKRAKAARVSVTQNQVAGKYAQSKKTGLWYITYGGINYSCPFGAKAATDKELDAFQEIKTALETAFKNIHLIKEDL
jgi:hypothetical protein